MDLKLTDFVSYADAQAHFSKDALWALFDGDRSSLNIAHECIDRHRAKGVAIRIAFDDGHDEAYTFDELSRWSSQFAHYLLARGLETGDRVAILLEPSLPFYVALFGTMKAGLVAVPMFTLFGGDALAMRLADCTPSLLLTSSAKAQDVPSDVPECPHLEVMQVDEDFLSLLEGFDDAFQMSTSARDMALFQYTSGTTRELPEAVKHRHQAVVTVAIAALYATGVRPGDRFCCPSSPAWGHGLAHGTLAPLALGVCVSAWSGRFEGARFLEVLARHRITNLSAAATHYRMMKNCGSARDHDYELEKISFTGEPIDSDTADYIEKVVGLPVRSMYGTTEVGVILGCYPGAPDLAMKPGCLGKPMPGVRVEVHRRDGTQTAIDEVGELIVERGDQWFPTKDLGRVDSEGYFYHAGRADDVIISAGWTMSAVEIEDALLKHESVDEIAVIGVADELRGQVVKAFVVTRAVADDELVEALKNWVRDRLGSHEYPRQIEFVQQLPKTPAGKVNRKVLRDRERASAKA